MAIEIERKFLVRDGWRAAAGPGERFRQGLITRTGKGKVRVRLSGAAASLTIKSARRGIVRDEYEYPIPVEDAEEMLERLCQKPLLEKTRHIVMAGADRWEIDIIHGVASDDGEGDLVLAEIELETPDQVFGRPAWLGREVTHDPRFRNIAMVKRRRVPEPARASGATDIADHLTPHLAP